MRESARRQRRRSRPVKEQSFPISKFGRIAVALWPYKPALHLAGKVGCTERAANLWIAGRRKPSARAVIEIMREIE